MPPSDTFWPRLSELIGESGEVALLGAPLAAGSVTPGSCDQAPARLRSVLSRLSRYDVETCKELRVQVADLGNVALDGLTVEQSSVPIREAVTNAARAHPLILLAGGNNAISRPALLGLGDATGFPLERIALITLDAHFDMRETSGGLSNGNPVRALIEDGLPGVNIAQVGLAPYANTALMHGDALDGGHCVITIGEVRSHGIAAALDKALSHVRHCDAIMVDCDIDVIDRAQMPGAPGARPGGMAAHDFFFAVHRLASHPKVRLIDLTEWDPSLDPADLSALTAARWLAEALAGYAARSGQPAPARRTR